ncbi:MAG: hypothetical protein ABL908_19540 [Hyphomicrobium sp.]
MYDLSLILKAAAIDTGSGAKPCTECAFSAMKKGLYPFDRALSCTRYVTPLTGDPLACTDVRGDSSLCGADGVGFQPPEDWEGAIDE